MNLEIIILLYQKSTHFQLILWSSDSGLDETQLSDLRHLIECEIESSIGCPMMYMVAEAIQVTGHLNRQHMNFVLLNHHES